MAGEAEARVADEAEVTEIDEADEADLTNDADVANKAIATVDIKLDDLDEVNKEVDNSNKAIESDDTDEVKEAIALDEDVDANELETNKADPSVVSYKFD